MNSFQLVDGWWETAVLLPIPTAKKKRGIVAAQAKCVGHSDVHVRLPRYIGNVVKVTGWIRGGVVDGGRNDIFTNGF